MMTQNTPRSLIVQLLVVVASATIAITAAKAEYLTEFTFKAPLATATHDLPDSEAGDIYREGLAFLEQKNYVRARQKFDEGMRANNPASMGELGRLYQEGKGVRQDIEHANRIWERGARRGDPLSSSALGTNKLMGNGIEINVGEAIKLLSVGFGKNVVEHYPDFLWAVLQHHGQRDVSSLRQDEADLFLGHMIDLANVLLTVPEYEFGVRDWMMDLYGKNSSRFKDLNALHAIVEPAALDGDPAAAYWQAILVVSGFYTDGTPQWVRFWSSKAVAGGYERAYAAHATMLVLGYGGSRRVSAGCRYAHQAIDAGYGHLLPPEVTQACDISLEARE